ncbi:hypothetical protein VP1G_11128 [Cytospora mali]|uniref:Uncharacterized protein n=1 Tax=Cytospora mali TaxID=578113 RepID=A0A194V9C2_CYTMA|nr:hypothetical protein VP1G_11128 [Valsa mali var. pyri (nom. inval.)]
MVCLEIQGQEGNIGGTLGTLRTLGDLEDLSGTRPLGRSQFEVQVQRSIARLGPELAHLENGELAIWGVPDEALVESEDEGGSQGLPLDLSSAVFP